MKKHHFLVAFVTGDDREGTNVAEFWAKNWSLRRLKVLTKQTARQRGINRSAVAFPPSVLNLRLYDFPWDEASVFEVVPR